jgi:hypothetical protein
VGPDDRRTSQKGTLNTGNEVNDSVGETLTSDSPYRLIKCYTHNGDLVNVWGPITKPLINPEYKEDVMYKSSISVLKIREYKHQEIKAMSDIVS